MVSVIATYKTLLGLLLKFVGMKAQIVEIEPGTVLSFWVPAKPKSPKKPNKPAVVLLHGFDVEGILTWQFQILALARKYDVYVPDFLFFGASITDKLERSTEFQAQCVATGLKKIGVEKCILVGFSYGGMVSFRMAEMYPDLVDSMVVTGSVTALTESISKASLERIGFSSWPDYLLPTTVQGVKVLFDIAFWKSPPLPKCILKEALEMTLEHRKERAELLEALVVKDEDFKVSHHYKQKIYFLTGKNDRIFDVETVNNVKSQLGDIAKLQYVEKAGHLLPLERPCLYNKLLKKILAHFTEDMHQE